MAASVTIRQKILKILSDGMIHSREELWECLDDPLAPISYLNTHISLLRKELPASQMIHCITMNRKFFYRHMRHLVNPNDGKS